MIERVVITLAGLNRCGAPVDTETEVIPPDLTLHVDVAPQGGGSVDSAPAGISGCTGACDATFPFGTKVTLTGTPSPGFSGPDWSGDCSGGGTCTLTMDADRTVHVSFPEASGK